MRLALADSIDPGNSGSRKNTRDESRSFQAINEKKQTTILDARSTPAT